MVSRTTVNVSLTPELGAFVQKRVKSGRYQTASEVVREAPRLLQQKEEERVEALRELKGKLRRGVAQEKRGDLLDGEAVFDELRDLIEERRKAKTKASSR
jgi:antitoxin ParD1/3/4